MKDYISQVCGIGLDLLLKRHFVLYGFYIIINHAICKLKKSI